VEEQTVPDSKDDMPNFDDLNADQPTDDLSNLDVPDFQADDSSPDFGSIDQPEEAGVAEAGEAEGFDPMAFDSGSAEDSELGKDDAEDEEEEKKAGLLASLAEASPYTVMLGLTLMVLAIGIVCLIMEWKAYDYNTKAKDPRLSSNTVPAVSTDIGESAFLKAVPRVA
jgi:hypothetical protein